MELFHTPFFYLYFCSRNLGRDDPTKHFQKKQKDFDYETDKKNDAETKRVRKHV